MKRKPWQFLSNKKSGFEEKFSSSLNISGSFSRFLSSSNDSFVSSFYVSPGGNGIKYKKMKRNHLYFYDLKKNLITSPNRKVFFSSLSIHNDGSTYYGKLQKTLNNENKKEDLSIEDIESIEINNETSLIQITMREIIPYQIEDEDAPFSNNIYRISKSRACFHALYLRDNCQSNFDENTGQRIVSTYSFFPTTEQSTLGGGSKCNEFEGDRKNNIENKNQSPSPIRILKTKIVDILSSASERNPDDADQSKIYTENNNMKPLQALEITWEDNHSSRFPIDWLKSNAFNLERIMTKFVQKEEFYNKSATISAEDGVEDQLLVKVLLESKDVTSEINRNLPQEEAFNHNDRKVVYDIKQYYWNKSHLQESFPEYSSTGGIPKISYEGLFPVQLLDKDLDNKTENANSNTHTKKVDGADMQTVARGTAEYTTLKQKALFKHLRDYGLVIIEGLNSSEELNENLFGAQVIQIGKLLGNYPRTTHYGLTFDVKSEKKPVHLAYTSVALDFHTDLNYREKTPGIQLLHCLANSCVGGESTFVDGFHVATTLKKENPRAYHLLATTPIHFQVKDSIAYHSYKVPIIVLSQEEITHQKWPLQSNRNSDATIMSRDLVEVHFNDRTRGPINNIPPEEMGEFYQAMKLWSEIINRPENIVQTKLTPGQMVIFNNRRIFHSRNSFDPSSGNRHLIGAYVEYDEFLSNLRKRNLHTPPYW